MTPLRLLLAALAVALASSASAHHRQTPPVTMLTDAGDTPLPRVPAPGTKTIVLAVSAGPGRKIVSISPWKNRREPALQTLIAPLGAHANPAVSLGGRFSAFDTASDPLDQGLPGRQVIGAFLSALFPVSSDPSGTSENPSVDTTGRNIAFESTGDLAGTGTPGTRQVFLRDASGSVRQLSTGVGSSRNPVLSAKQRLVLFESTSDPTTGADTGISQIWLGTLDAGTVPAPITNGFGPSLHPAVSNDGRLVVFESTADLAGDVPVDTGVPQVYVYDTKTATYARITDDVLGCTLPSAYKAYRDWRIAFVCSGEPFFYMLRSDQRYRVPTDGGTTQRVIAELGVHFLVMSTTANLLDGTDTAGNQVYLVNLFKRPGQPVPGQASWFPSRGIPPL
jgi:hypothetical protein